MLASVGLMGLCLLSRRIGHLPQEILLMLEIFSYSDVSCSTAVLLCTDIIIIIQLVAKNISYYIPSNNEKLAFLMCGD